jgi:hypothetical protein
MRPHSAGFRQYRAAARGRTGLPDHGDRNGGIPPIPGEAARNGAAERCRLSGGLEVAQQLFPLSIHIRWGVAGRAVACWWACGGRSKARLPAASPSRRLPGHQRPAAPDLFLMGLMKRTATARPAGWGSTHQAISIWAKSRPAHCRGRPPGRNDRFVRDTIP